MNEQIYEYLCVEIGNYEAAGRTEILNEHAAGGWELICAGAWWAYFKRLVKRYWTVPGASWSCAEVSEEA